MRKLISLWCAAALLLALPAGAYTVYLKDGSKIIAKTKYRLQGDRAVLTLPNGAQTVIALNAIDVKRTEEENSEDYGTAVVIEGREKRQLKRGEKVGAPKSTRVSDLIAEGSIASRERPEARRPAEEDRAALLSGPKGWPDLMRLPRSAYANTAVAAQLSILFEEQTFRGTKIFQGTTSTRPLVEITTASEVEVMKALSASATVLLKVRESYAEVVKELELVMLTPNGERAGQFQLNPQQATDLATKKIDPAVFFLSYVQF